MEPQNNYKDWQTLDIFVLFYNIFFRRKQDMHTKISDTVWVVL